MKNLLALFIYLLTIHLAFAQTQTTFILVRHAEKASDGSENPPLNNQGKQRAQKLAEMLENQQITALYATPFKRTQETLKPIAEHKSLVIESYDPFSNTEWLNSLIAKHPNGTVIVSGHSNTIPQLANSLLGQTVFSQFNDDDYSNLIVIMTNKLGEGKLIRLKF